MVIQLKLPRINHYKVHVFNTPFLHSLYKWGKTFDNSLAFCIFLSILKIERLLGNWGLQQLKKTPHFWLSFKTKLGNPISGLHFTNILNQSLLFPTHGEGWHAIFSIYFVGLKRQIHKIQTANYYLNLICYSIFLYETIIVSFINT